MDFFISEYIANWYRKGEQKLTQIEIEYLKETENEPSSESTPKVKWRESSVFEILPYYGELHL